MRLLVTGDTHGEQERLTYINEHLNDLSSNDYLFICGDFGYLFNGNQEEYDYLKYLANTISYTLCFVDGNHENFTLLNNYDISLWHGGKVHVIEYDDTHNPKIIHLIRGQVYTLENKRIFVFGGGFSRDYARRKRGESWWPEDEMPNSQEMNEAIQNLEKVNYKVDYIITHTAPYDTMSMLHLLNTHEQSLNNFLEYIREKATYKHWYMGHQHMDEDLWRNQTILWYSIRNMENNEEVL